MIRNTLGRFAQGFAATLGAIALTASGAAPAPSMPVATKVPGKANLLIGGYDLGTLGYLQDEYFISGEATSYVSTKPLGGDGRWSASPGPRADYKTRIVVMRPSDPAKFNGTVLVEWLNVSGGLDAPADWLMAHRELMRAGYAYVAVSAQKVGIEGGASMGADMSLKKMAPDRYQSLHHPGDAFAYDIFSQAGRLVHAKGVDSILGPLVAERVLAAGESQSAHFMTTYVNAVDPLAKVYDGFFIHSRFSGAAPLDGASIMGKVDPKTPAVIKFRPDLRVPVLTLITETDLIGGARAGYAVARQPETAHLRVWEVAGTAHADVYMLQVAGIDSGLMPIEKLAAAYAPSKNLMGTKLAKPYNFAPQHHYVVQAALATLDHWVRTGKAPVSAPRMALSDGEHPAAVRDTNGLATGGVRTPWIDVPVARTSGVSDGSSIMASLFGSGEMFDKATLDRLYPGGKSEYLKHFTVALDRSIKAGFILAADRQEILDVAAVSYGAH